MRKILLPFAMMGLISAPLAACDVEGSPSDTTNPPTDTIQPDTSPTDTTTPDTTPDPEYRAIIVDDDGFFQNHRPSAICATSSVGAHGADIDAVGLFESDGTTLVGYFDTVDAKLGTSCTIAAKYSNATQARGAPNGTLMENFVSLGGGAIIGEFGDFTETPPAPVGKLFPGDVVVVYEIGDKFCGGVASCVGDESYHVYVASRLDCLNSGNRSACQKRVTGSNGAKGEATVPLTGF